MTWPHLLEQQGINTSHDHDKYGQFSCTAICCKQKWDAFFCVGSTPLHVGAAAGHQGIVDALLASKADLAIQDCMVGQHCEPAGACRLIRVL